MTAEVCSRREEKNDHSRTCNQTHYCTNQKRTKKPTGTKVEKLALRSVFSL